MMHRGSTHGRLDVRKEQLALAFATCTERTMALAARQPLAAPDPTLDHHLKHPKNCPRKRTTTSHSSHSH